MLPQKILTVTARNFEHVAAENFDGSQNRNFAHERGDSV